jgi:hypothetical protein
MRRLRLAMALALSAPVLAAAQQGGQFGVQRPTDDDRARAAAGKSDFEEQQEKLRRNEGVAKLPAYPKAQGAGLIPLRVDGGSSFRFFIDPASVDVGPDRVVRYTLVAISPAGYENVSFEGMRCQSNEYKIYARGHDGRWSGDSTEWRLIEARSMQRWHNELRRRYFCVHYNAPVLDAAEAVDALRRGGHPMVTDSSLDRTN